MISKKEYIELLKKHPDSILAAYTQEEKDKMFEYIVGESPDLFEALAKEDPSLIKKDNVA